MKDMKFSSQKLAHLNSHGGHLNRRQFVGLGLLGATSTMFLPSPLSVFSNAFAASAAPGNVVYLGFDLAGGAGLSGNFLVGKEGGPEDLLKSYSRLGWNPRTQGYDSRFGLPMAKADVSKIFQGLTETMSAAAQANFRMASYCHISRDDTSDNPLSVAHLMSSIVGNDGMKIVKKPLGTSNSTSGGQSRSVKEISDYSALTIGNLNDVLNIASIPTPLGVHPREQVLSVLKRLSGLSGLQAGKIFQDQTAQNTMNRSYAGLSNMIGREREFDPRVMPDIQKIYNLNGQTAITDRNAIRAGIVSATLDKKVGASVITIGGCDYHDGSFATGDAKDLEIGREIGRAVELAHQRKQALFIHIFSDGSVFSTDGARNWAGDDGEKSMTVIGYYDPNKTPTYRSSHSIQFGSYTDGQGVNRDTLIGGTPSLGAYAVIVNYLNVAGRLSEMDNYIPRVFSSAEVDQLLAFNA